MSCVAPVVMALLVIAAAKAGAQDPVKLPGVTVKATSDMPGPKLLTGIVVDTAGNTLAGVEITIPALERRLFSTADGTFRFDNMPKGTYSMRARKIGYAQQVRDFRVDTAGGTAEFQLLPIAQALPAMVSSASRGGLGGVVGDTADVAIPGAQVKVIGRGMTTETDSMGGFYMPVPPGHYMVAITKVGFAPRMVGVSIPSDSGRRITAWLQPFTGHVPPREVHNIEDLGTRQAWTLPSHSSFYTHEDLEKLDITWVYDAVEMTGAKNQAREAYSRDCMVVVNGGPSIVNLATLTVDDVESIEVYPGGSGFSSPVRARTPGSISLGRRGAAAQTGTSIGMSNTDKASIENGTRYCPLVYVWTR